MPETNYKLKYRDSNGTEDTINIYSDTSEAPNNLFLMMPNMSNGYVPLTTDLTAENASQVRLTYPDNTEYALLRTVIPSTTYTVTITQPTTGTITVNGSTTSPQTFNSGETVLVELNVAGTLLIDGVERTSPYSFAIVSNVNVAASIPAEKVVVCGGLNGAVVYSTNQGQSWNLTSLDGTNQHLRSLLYHNNMFIAGMANASMGYSSDGINWVSKTISNPDSTGATQSVSQIVYGNGLYFGVKGALQYYTKSSDGINWENLKYDLSMAGYCAAYGGDKFVLLGLGGNGYHSTDLVTWTSFTVPVTQAIYGMAYANNRFVAIGAGRPIYSTDGLTWTLSASTTGTMRSVAYGNNTWVAVGDNRRYAYSKDNGVTWTYGTFTNQAVYNIVAFVDGKFYAAAGANGFIYTSTDGVTWTGAANGVTTDPIYSIAGN